MRICCLLADGAVAASPEVAALLDDPAIEVVHAADGIGAALDLPTVFGWARELSERLAADDVVAAVVVLHPDTLAEAGYLLDLAVRGAKPLVVTGAMRPADHRAADGPRNLAASLTLAGHPALRGASAVAVIAGTVHAVRDVTRVCAASVTAFESPRLGPLGLVGPAGPVALTRRPPAREHVAGARIEPHVAHVAAQLGADGAPVAAAVAAGARGIVAETFASGAVPPALGEELARAVAGGVAVVAASRARGEPSAAGGEPGGHAWLADRGVLRLPGLAPEKARVRLALALGLDDAAALRAAFTPASSPSPRSTRSPRSTSSAPSAAPPPGVRAPRPRSTP